MYLNYEILDPKVIFATTLLMSVPFLKAVGDCDGTKPLIVSVKQGLLRGTTLTSRREKPYCAFLGIPYAQPPIGHLRFRPPSPIRKWNGILNATKEAPDCTLPSMLNGAMLGSEDCLYLNVYTTQLKNSSNNTKLLDVAVWIHGGDFYGGTTRTPLFDPYYIVKEGVVFVSCNYRVGVFGFLSTGDDESPGNYGMKDQVAVLQWVKENIESFGGNPNSITISGHSAGGASVHYQLLSSMSQGFFHRAISLDGSAVNPWAYCKNPLEIAHKQANLIGCPTESTASLVECMRQVPAEVINRNLLKMFLIWYEPTPEYAPVKEIKSTRNPHPFLTDDPLSIILSGNFTKVPWMMGGSNNGMALYVAPMVNIQALRDELVENAVHMWPILLLLSHSVKKEQIRPVMNQIEKFYSVKSQNVTDENKWIEIITDRHLIHGIHKSALLHSLSGHKPIYKYNLAYRGHVSTTLISTLKNYGTSHGDELVFMFRDNILFWDSNDREVKSLMSNLWINFVKHGNPTPPKQMNPHDDTGLLKEIVWEPISFINESNVKIQYFNIGQVMLTYPSLYLSLNLGPVKLNMAENLFKDRIKFWDSLPLSENVPCSVCEIPESVSSSDFIRMNLIIICVTVINFSIMF